MLAPSNRPLSFIYRTLSALWWRVSLTPPSAVSLRLTDQNHYENLPEAEPQEGIASIIFLESRNSKPEAYRTVLRQRRTAHCSIAALQTAAPRFKQRDPGAQDAIAVC